MKRGCGLRILRSFSAIGADKWTEGKFRRRCVHSDIFSCSHMSQLVTALSAAALCVPRAACCQGAWKVFVRIEPAADRDCVWMPLSAVSMERDQSLKITNCTMGSVCVCIYIYIYIYMYILVSCIYSFFLFSIKFIIIYFPLSLLSTFILLLIDNLVLIFSCHHSLFFILLLPYTRWFKYDRDWFVCKQAALRSSSATLREWSHNLHPPSCSG